MAFLDENSSVTYQYLCVVPSGLGFASVVTSVLIALGLLWFASRLLQIFSLTLNRFMSVSSVDRADMATATGLSYLARYIGQCVGIALSSSLLQSVLTSQLKTRITGDGAAEVSLSNSPFSITITDHLNFVYTDYRKDSTRGYCNP